MAAVGIHTIIIGESASSTWHGSQHDAIVGERRRDLRLWPTQIGARVPGYEIGRHGPPVYRARAHGGRRAEDVGRTRQRRRAVGRPGRQPELGGAGGAPPLDRRRAVDAVRPPGLSIAGFYNAVAARATRNQALSLQIADAMFAPFAAHVKSRGRRSAPCLAVLARPAEQSDRVQPSDDRRAVGNAFWRRLREAAHRLRHTIAPQVNFSAPAATTWTTVRATRARVTQDLGRHDRARRAVRRLAALRRGARRLLARPRLFDRRPAEFDRVKAQLAVEADRSPTAAISYESATNGSRPRRDWHTLPAALYQQYVTSTACNGQSRCECRRHPIDLTPTRYARSPPPQRRGAVQALSPVRERVGALSGGSRTASSAMGSSCAMRRSFRTSPTSPQSSRCPTVPSPCTRSGAPPTAPSPARMARPCTACGNGTTQGDCPPPTQEYGPEVHSCSTARGRAKLNLRLGRVNSASSRTLQSPSRTVLPLTAVRADAWDGRYSGGEPFLNTTMEDSMWRATSTCGEGGGSYTPNWTLSDTRAYSTVVAAAPCCSAST